MMKRIAAFVLCLAMLIPCFAGCSHGENDKGAYIRMYLSEPVYDLDPLYAFDNEASLQVIGLLFEGLFYADENGKPKKALVDKYKYSVDKQHGTYALTLTLKTTNWSDGVRVSANDVQFTFRRLFSSDVHTEATAMLYDIKNARAIAAGDDSIDHLAVVVVDSNTVEIQFERDIDVDAFLLTLCSPALYPLRDDMVSTNADWAKKKTSSLVCSGPFMVRSMNFEEKDGFVLERNTYYYRDRQKDKIDKYVTPFRIVVDYSTDAAEQIKLYNSGEAGTIYYFGHIPLAVRGDAAFAATLKKVDVDDTPSTLTYYLNENAEIGGVKLFENVAVRKALSLAIDRDAIAEALVYAKAADGLVPWNVRNRTDQKADFRKKAESLIATSANVEEAKSLLRSAGITASDYSFAITVAAYDEDHVAVANLVAAAWKALGFKVNVKALDTYMRTITTVTLSAALDAAQIEEARLALLTLNTVKSAEFATSTDETGNAMTTVTVTAGKKLKYYDIEDALAELGWNATGKTTQTDTGIYENPYRDALLSGEYQVIARDLVATSADAFAYLAPFATAYSGNGYRAEVGTDGQLTYVLNPHQTGYQSEAFNAKIDETAAATKEKTRAALLHEAEAILLADMPVIPIVYNQKATLKSSKLSKVDDRLFYTDFAKAKLSGYWKIALRDGFVTEE